MCRVEAQSLIEFLIQSKILKSVHGDMRGIDGGKEAVELNGLAISSSKLRFPPRKMEIKMPTAQGYWRG